MGKIMLCDDTPELVDTIGKELRNLNFNITNIVYSGQDCIDAIKNGAAPDLLILDISMPKMPGYEVVKQLKKSNPEIKMLIFSAYNDINVVKAMIRLGVNGFAEKGIKPIELAEIIRKVLNGETYFPPEHLFSAEAIETMKQEKIPWAEQLTLKEIQAAQLLANDETRKTAASIMQISPSAFNKKIERIFKKTGQRAIIGALNWLKKVGMIQ